MNPKMIKSKGQVKSPEGRNALIPAIKLTFNNILTSAHQINTDHSKLVMRDKDMSDKQVVVCAGPGTELKVGDWVAVNVEMFPKEKRPGKHDMGNKIIVHPPLEKIGTTDYLFMSDRHIKYVIEKEEDAVISK